MWEFVRGIFAAAEKGPRDLVGTFAAMSVTLDILDTGPFGEVLSNVASALESIRADGDDSMGQVAVMSTTEFDVEVGRLQREIASERGSAGLPVFTPERLGGIVAGKTLARALDYQDVTIVLNGNLIDWSNPQGQVSGLAILAHELGHVAIGRARYASGVLEGEPPPPSVTGTEAARSLARITCDEFRADLIATSALGTAASVPLDDGSTRPATIYDLVGSRHSDCLRDVLAEEVYPGWPDTVDAYRTYQIDLEELIRRITLSTESVLSIVAHAEAHAFAGRVDRPLQANSELRGAELYVAPAWDRLLAILARRPPVPTTLSEVRALEDHIASEGTAAILQMWKRLGLTVEEHGNRRWAMRVSEPMR